MNIHFIRWVIIQYNCNYFLAQIVPALATGALSVGLCISLAYSHLFFVSTFLLYGTT